MSGGQLPASIESIHLPSCRWQHASPASAKKTTNVTSQRIVKDLCFPYSNNFISQSSPWCKVSGYHKSYAVYKHARSQGCRIWRHSSVTLGQEELICLGHIMIRRLPLQGVMYVQGVPFPLMRCGVLQTTKIRLTRKYSESTNLRHAAISVHKEAHLSFSSPFQYSLEPSIDNEAHTIYSGVGVNF